MFDRFTVWNLKEMSIHILSPLFDNFLSNAISKLVEFSPMDCDIFAPCDVGSRQPKNNSEDNEQEKHTFYGMRYQAKPCSAPVLRRKGKQAASQDSRHKH